MCLFEIQLLYMEIMCKLTFNGQQGVFINFAITLVLITIFERFFHQNNAEDMLFFHF